MTCMLKFISPMSLFKHSISKIFLIDTRNHNILLIKSLIIWQLIIIGCGLSMAFFLLKDLIITELVVLSQPIHRFEKCRSFPEVNLEEITAPLYKILQDY